MPESTLLRLPDIPTLPGLTNAQAMILNARYPSSRQTVANCMTCGGSKTFRWLGPDGQPADYECPCADQYRLSRWLWHCGVLPRWQRLGWKDYTQLPAKVIEASMDYLTNLDRYRSAGIGLMLTGPKGTGKTLLAHLILKEAIGKGVDVYATTFTQMIDEFAGGWRDKEQGQWFNRRVRDAGLLFIDDLGRERNKGEGTVGENMLETVVRHRVGCLLPTIITTNIEHGNIETTYGGHTVSLLSESAMHIEVPGLDSRVSMREREEGYLKMGLIRPVVLG